ncbi:Holliday junction ATP-dependent DNA helicase RuvB [Gemmata obscuriglobus]|uniref:ATP-dependent DNA helicase RuvB n=1 Tax=Gemmata obscuriglobus TaxID=114 RepID=A0A2Z3HDN9_9BACT|nr:AAA family ATPase [Gemmata obscuriglobus]AWM39814.1 ATP-dependent DNA helicase RuvB [Gemmata obscuriglobus]QEG27066.1 Holliday junction ATP-dependent DNA helicase RuvB [Gemmata obscuriglobus]VTS03491.1 holliday junction dna helicase : Holliday junction DNA helicase RuvB domain protein OS=Planctomyces brasiliensis (strain ATCC 49424 / DSM 5305 / JCM 21570 / NBRC 103401 / IFAM 1448) GN=Plabr_1152 PE=4 SV=1: RuvB_N: RuvB_C [Gemmata obscuriglobus UQM 2246]
MSQHHEIGDVAPTSLAHLIGQRSVVEQVRVALDAAHQDAKKFDHALLCGPPGCGKTQTAKVIAQEMAGEFQEVLGQAIQSPADLNALLLGAKDRDVILLDEAHELDREYQTALYLAIDQRRVLLQTKGRTPQAIPLADFTLLLATTDEFKLLQPLRDRMRLCLRFGFYSAEELAELIRQRAAALAWDVDVNVYRPIAARSRGTPRLALRLLQAARRVCRSQGDERVTGVHLERACLLEGIDGLGLGPTEQQYLAVLGEGANRLNVIASRLGLPTRTVAEVTEPFLIRAGLVAKDDQGRRQLTAEGRDHFVSICRKNGV